MNVKEKIIPKSLTSSFCILLNLFYALQQTKKLEEKSTRCGKYVWTTKYTCYIQSVQMLHWQYRFMLYKLSPGLAI